MLAADGLSKLYRLGEIGSGTLKEDFRRFWAKLQGKEDPYKQISLSNTRDTHVGDNFLWALRDISFCINKGDTLGLVGRNGAGKSTLLKIIARVVYPTDGAVYLNGKIASMLEVGTGFHDMLSGRDNIYMSGSILGMSRTRIRSRFDDIVAFSGLSRFIDTPIRRYSVGMRLRLSFAVSAYLDADILLLDEVLAVGDYAFRNKALAHIQELARSDRTIVYVAHQLNTVRQLCNKGILLEEGRSKVAGDINAVLDAYGETQRHDAFYTFAPPTNTKESLGYIYQCSVLDASDTLCADPVFYEPWGIQVDFQLNQPLEEVFCLLKIFLPTEQLVSASQHSITKLTEGKYSVCFRSSPSQLGVGTYPVSLYLSSRLGAFESIERQVVLYISHGKPIDMVCVEPQALLPAPLRTECSRAATK